MTRKLTQVKMRLFPERDFGAGDVSLTMYGETMEFGILGESWHEMVKAGVEQLRQSRPNGRYWQSIGSNYAEFPIVYNYRHVLELYLKGILVAAEPALILNGEEGINPEVFKEHKFGKLRPDLERAFAALGISYDFGVDGFRTIKDFRCLLSDLDHLEVRYPMDKHRKPAMGDRWVRFNLFEFAAVMDRILDVLRWYPSGISEEVDARCEMAYEAQQEAWANADHDYDPPDPPDYEPDYYGD
jgi:hypothetical protein